MDRADIDCIKPVRTFLLHWLNETREGDVKVVQVGANDGSMADPLTPVLGRFGWQAVLIEPVPRYFKALSAKYASNDNFRPCNFAISKEAGKATIYHLDEAHEEDYPGWARALLALHRQRFPKRNQFRKRLDWL